MRTHVFMAPPPLKTTLEHTSFTFVDSNVPYVCACICILWSALDVTYERISLCEDLRVCVGLMCTLMPFYSSVLA